MPIVGKVPVALSSENKVHYPCLTPPAEDIIELGLTRKNSWSLPEQALSAAFLDTITILVLRFNFQNEIPDNPNTTGSGHLNVSDPLANPTDSANYYNTVRYYNS